MARRRGQSVWALRTLGAVLTLGATVFAGCSALKMALNLAPWYAERQVLEILPKLTPEQHQSLKDELQRYWAWNKRTMMPTYAAALRDAGDRIADGGKAKPLSVEPFSTLYTQSIEPLLKPATALLRSLDAGQLDGLEKRLAQRQEQARERYLADPDATLQRRVKKLRSAMEDLAGPLNPAQQQRLLQISREFPIPYQAWLMDRGRRQQQLLKALRAKRSDDEIQALLRDWWMRSRTGDGDREEWQWDDKALQKQVDDLVALLEPAQRLRARGKLQELAGQLETLANDPAPVPRPTLP